MNRAARHLMGNSMKRRSGSRVKSKKTSPRKAPTLKIKVKGSPSQVRKALRTIVDGPNDENTETRNP